MTKRELIKVFEKIKRSGEANEIMSDAFANLQDGIDYDIEDIEDLQYDTEEVFLDFFEKYEEPVDYLSHIDIDDISEAIKNGETTIKGIAYYYLSKELNNIFKKLERACDNY